VLNRVLLFVVVLFLVASCTTYTYENPAIDDPLLTFGNPKGLSGTRSFSLNVKGSDRCEDYLPTGTISKTNIGASEKVREYYVPKESVVKLISSYSSTDSSGRFSFCKVGPVSFIAQANKKYSIDIYNLGRKCVLHVSEIVGDGIKDRLKVNLKKENSCN